MPSKPKPLSFLQKFIELQTQMIRSNAQLTGTQYVQYIFFSPSIVL
jgi:dolichyl-phosphate-mannose--protein O-mannosyl transferase